MNSFIDDRSSCSSAVDPKLNPATAAVDQLKFFPDWEFQHMRLLSEGGEYYDDQVDENGNYCIYDVQILGYEKLARGTFSMTALSQISDAISRECERTVLSNSPVPFSQSPKDIRNFCSIKKTAGDCDANTKKQRPLVRCIACESHLAQLDSSPSVAVHERRHPSASPVNPNNFSE